MAGAEMGVLRGVDNWEVYVRDGYTYFWHGSGGMALQLQHTVESIHRQPRALHLMRSPRFRPAVAHRPDFCRGEQATDDGYQVVFKESALAKLKRCWLRDLRLLPPHHCHHSHTHHHTHPRTHPHPHPHPHNHPHHPHPHNHYHPPHPHFRSSSLLFLSNHMIMLVILFEEPRLPSTRATTPSSSPPSSHAPHQGGKSIQPIHISTLVQVEILTPAPGQKDQHDSLLFAAPEQWARS